MFSIIKAVLKVNQNIASFITFITAESSLLQTTLMK